MNRYLLLRDNKQSGPYTVSELIQKGIKPYDLVWLDGKSAAWRYPSEIEELKAYAPAVEEQPYDRFYKKPSTEKKEEKPAEKKELRFVERDFRPATTPPVIESGYVAEPLMERTNYAPVPETPPAQPIQPRKIYVTLPGTKQIDKNTRVIRSTSVETTPVSINQAPVQNQHLNVTRKEPEAVPQITGYTTRETINPSFSDRIPRNEIRNEPSVMSEDRLSRMHPLKTRWVMPAVASICLLLGGIIIGLIISNSRQQSNNDLNKLVKQIQERGAAKDPGKTVSPIVPDQVSEQVPSESGFATSSELPVSNEPPVEEKRLPKTVSPKPVNTQIANTGDTQANQLSVKVEKPAITLPAVVTVEKPNVSVDVENAKKNIRQLVSVQNNKYKTGVLGGISDLQLTVTNKSEFELDMVEVEVEYLGPEKRVVKRQTIIFNNIKPGKEVMQEVPKTNRGVTVTSNIKGINSKTLGLAYTGL